MCYACPNGTFSDVISAQQNCTEHKTCGAAGQQLLLKGSSWHDSVCTSCQSTGEITGHQHLMFDLFPTLKEAADLYYSCWWYLLFLHWSVVWYWDIRVKHKGLQPPGESRSTPAVIWEFVPWRELRNNWTLLQNHPALRWLERCELLFFFFFGSRLDASSIFSKSFFMCVVFFDSDPEISPSAAPNFPLLFLITETECIFKTLHKTCNAKKMIILMSVTNWEKIPDTC